MTLVRATCLALSLTATLTAGCSLLGIDDGLRGEDQCPGTGWARSPFADDFTPEFHENFCPGECDRTLPWCDVTEGQICILEENDKYFGHCEDMDAPDLECSDATNNRAPDDEADELYIFDARFSLRSDVDGFVTPEGSTCAWVVLSAYDNVADLPDPERPESLEESLEVVMDPPGNVTAVYGSPASYHDDGTSSSITWNVYFGTVCYTGEDLAESMGFQLEILDRTSNRICARRITEQEMNDLIDAAPQDSQSEEL